MPSTAACPTLYHLARWRAAHQPGRHAFTFLRDGERDETHLSYAALDRGARAVAGLLQRHTRLGDRVLLLYPPGLEYITAFLGCLYAGVVAVPVYRPNPRLERTLVRLRAIVRDSTPVMALTTPELAASGATLARRDPAFAGIRWLGTDGVGDRPAEVEAARAWREPVVDPDRLAFLQYTSGSTGTPRGVMVSHANLMHNEALIRRVAALDADEVLVSWLPLYHDMGLIGAVLQPLYSGFGCTLMSPANFLQQPVRWLRAITQYRATVSGAPNFAYDLCAQQIGAEQRAGLDLSSWRVAFNGAEPVRADTLEAFLAAFEPYGLRREAFRPCYGLAEATLLVSGGPAGRRAALVQVDKLALRRGRVRPGSGPEGSTLVGSGRVPAGQRVVIVDPATRRPSPPGQVGEIWVAGASITRGYWNAPRPTVETFQARLAGGDGQPFLRTGDLGFLHDDGELFVTSRLKDLIIIRGCNHAPQDIERTAEASHPALRPGCAAAFTLDGDGEPRLVIALEVRRQYLSVDSAQVASAIRRAVADEHELDVYTVVLLRTGTLPKTSSGKVQRQACRDAFLRGRLRQVGASIRPQWRPDRPADPAVGARVLAAMLDAAPEQRLAIVVGYLREQVAAAAGIAPVDVDADEPYLALGMDSLRLLQLRQRVETELGVVIELDRFLDHPTIAQLAVPVLAALERAVAGAWADVTALTDEEVESRLARLAVQEA